MTDERTGRHGSGGRLNRCVGHAEQNGVKTIDVGLASQRLGDQKPGVRDRRSLERGGKRRAETSTSNDGQTYHVRGEGLSGGV